MNEQGVFFINQDELCRKPWMLYITCQDQISPLTLDN